MPTTRTRRIAARLGVLAAALALTSATTAAISVAQTDEPTTPPTTSAPEPTSEAPATAASSPQSLADLQLSVALDKDEYDSGDKVTVTLQLVNAGDEQLGKLTGDTADGDLRVTERGELGELEDGILLDGGESFETTIAGYMSDVEDGTFDFTLSILGPPNDEGFSDDKDVSVSAPVTMTAGDYSGTIYADKNGNGELDGGEELSGVAVKVTNIATDTSAEETTDQDGRFTFADLPTGRYDVEFATPGNWQVVRPSREIEVTKDGADVTYRAVVPLTERLEVDAAFWPETDSIDIYSNVRVQIEITNTGTSTIEGIVPSRCNQGSGNNHRILPTEGDWGPLQAGADGVTVYPGETFTAQVFYVVPESAADAARLVLGCEFISPSMGLLKGPWGYDSLKIVEADVGPPESGSDDGSSSGDGSDGDGSGDDSDGDGGSASGGSSGSAEDDLALTGFGGMEILWIGLATLAAGALALWYARRRRTATEAGELG